MYVWVFCQRIPGQKMKPVGIPDIMRQALERAMVKTNNQQIDTNNSSDSNSSKKL